MSKKRPINPFYVLLLLAGCLFAITASAYGVMTVRQLDRGRSPSGVTSNRDSRFDDLIDQHGPRAMVIEIVLLGVGTLGAIAYDQRIDKLTVADGRVDTNKESS